MGMGIPVLLSPPVFWDCLCLIPVCLFLEGVAWSSGEVIVRVGEGKASKMGVGEEGDGEALEQGQPR